MSSRISRRNFLRLAGAGAAATVLVACAPAATPAPAEPDEPAEPEATEVPAAPEPEKVIFSSYSFSGFEQAMDDVFAVWLADNPNVELEAWFAGWGDYWPKLQTQVAAGEPPDVGIGDFSQVVTFAKGRVLAQLDDLIAGDDYPLDSLIQGGVAQYRWAEGDFDTGADGGQMYGLPSDAQPSVFYYNKTMFDEGGVDYPTDDWTWDDLIAAGQALTNPEEDKWGVGFPSMAMGRGCFLYQAGTTAVNEDYTKCLYDTPEGLAAFKYPWDLLHTYKIAPLPGGEAVNPFMSGRVALGSEGVWWIVDFSTITDFEWDMAVLPKNPTTGKGTTAVESDGWWIFREASNLDTAWSLMKFLVSPEGQTVFADLGFVIPPSIPEVAEVRYAQEPPANRGKALQNMLDDSEKFMYTFFESGTINSVVNPILDRAWLEGEDIELVLEEATVAFDEELEKAWELFEA